MNYTIDAKDKILGRIASESAVILQGKKSPNYDPRLSGDDVVVIKNASKLKISGAKYTQKIYYRHSGYVGNLKQQTFKELFSKSPEEVLQKAVYNMLPKNRLRKNRMKRLKIEL